jgi:hypothetical protein
MTSQSVINIFRYYRYFLVALLMSIFCISSTSGFAEKIKDPAFQPHAKALLEAFLRRSLTAAEWEQAQNDGSTEFEGDLNKVIDAAKTVTQILHEKDGKPAALHIRHRIAMGIVFDPKTINAPTTKLLLLLDPVAAIDIRQKKLMTLADVRALIAIHKFLTTNANPRDIELGTVEEAVKLSTALRTSLQKGGSLPELHTEAAALWTGLVQEWSNLSERDQGLVREYAKLSLTKGNAMLPDALYVQLVGWTSADVVNHQNALKMAKINQEFQNNVMAQSKILEMQTLVHETLMIGKTLESFSIPPPIQ